MKLIGVGLALLFCASCGIQTIEYLPPPPVESYLNQNDPTQVTFTHNAGLYSSTTDFQGYEIYYKIYPSAASLLQTQSYNLANDAGLLATTPTRDYLLLLGYQRLNNTDSAGGSIPLVSNPPGGEDVTLNFQAFLTAMNSANGSFLSSTQSKNFPRPVLLVGTASTDLFRTVTVNSGSAPDPDNDHVYFGDLYKPFVAATSDMSRSGTAVITGTTGEYEIDCFVAAYAFTPERTIYSQPVPWGVIGYLEIP